jgi:HD-like signal output (HDOD) protein
MRDLAARIGDLLIEAGIITAKQRNEALKIQSKQGGKIVEILMSLGHLTTGDFVDFLAKQPGVASIDLANYEIASDLIQLVPKDFALKHEVFPIDRMGKLLTLGMVCPLDTKTIESLEELTGLRVKPLLCSASDLRAAINRYYPRGSAPVTDIDGPASEEAVRGLEAPIRLRNAALMIREIDTLPVLPETAQRVREAMTDMKSSVSDVADIIVMDPPIAAKVLSVANSAAFGFPNRVDDLTLAVTLLGLRETYGIVLSCSVLNLFDSSPCFDYKAFWVEAMMCAAAARIVAKASGLRGQFGVFPAGLLHDIGRVALAEVARQPYSQVDHTLPPSELVAEEERIVGLSHNEAGYALAQHWELPPEIAEPIRFHHNPGLATEARQNVAIVALADVMAVAVGSEIDENQRLFEGYEDELALLDLDMEVAEAMLQDFLDRRDVSLRDALD